MGGKRFDDVCGIVMGHSPPGAFCKAMGVGIPLLKGLNEYGSHRA